MRLTLRTLLAYLDDVLEPADTKIIGQKIQESSMAQLLVSRIREVMRRRRLKAPEVFGPEMGIDPNIVSQYLDTTLPPSRYADVERVLLASDELLAEVAACHQVLPVWLANPLELSEESRESLYALGPVDATSQLVVPSEKGTPKSKTPESIPIRNGVASPARSISSRSADGDEVTHTVPDYLKPSPWPMRIFPSAIVGLLAILCVALLTPGILTGLRQAKREIQRKEVRDKTETVAEAEGVDSSKAGQDDVPEVASSRVEEAGRVPAAAVEGVAAGRTRQAVPAGIDPEPPMDEEDQRNPESPLEATVAKDEPVEGDPVRPVEPLADVPAPEGAVIPRTTFLTQGEAPVDVAIAYASNEGVLARLDVAQQHWLMVPHRSAMKSGEILANLDPFEAVLDFDSGKVRATLIGNTTVYLMDVAKSGIAGVGVRKGKIVFQNGRQEKEVSSKIGVSIGNDLWKLEFMESDTLCGLEVSPRESIQFQKLHDEHWYQATLYVISGKVKWTNPAGQSHEIHDHQALNILPEKEVQIRSNPISFTSVPEWCDSTKRKALPIRRYQSQVQFEKMFELNQPIDESMLSLVKNSKSPKIAELAAQGLATIENHAALVETLAMCPHEEARFVARDGLRQWLPMHPEHGAQLMKELELFYPPAEAEAIYQMLWGFSREDVTNSRSTSWQFVNWMRSPKPEIRELADFWVERLLGRKTEYRALGGTSVQRETQLHRLEEMIEKNNGLIKAP